MSRWSARGRVYTVAARQFLQANPTCHICAHGDADAIDHLVPASLAPELRFEPANWRPSHGVRGCPTCGRRCNSERGAKLAMPNRRRSRDW